MKKTLFYCSIVLLLYCFSLPVGVVCVPCGEGRAVEAAETDEVLMDEGVVEEATGEAEEKEIDYNLPWPGILPSHPLYFLKVARDRIWGFLVRDPAKKAEWALLMADKRVWAGLMLVDEGSEALGVTTLTKAEKYLEQALFKAQEAKAQGGDVTSLLDKLALASQKHEQILEGVLASVSEESRPVVEKHLEYSRRAYEQAMELKD